MKKTLFISIIIFLFFCKDIFTQTTSFHKTFGGTSIDKGSSVQQTADGGYVIVGRTQSFGAGSYDVYLIKTDAGGDTLWTKTFGGTYYDFGSSVQQTADGGYIVAGGTLSFGAGSTDVYLIKTDAGGNILWSKTFGGSTPDFGRSVQQTADGGYIIAGNTTSFGAGNEDFYLIKTNSGGNILWTKTFGGTFIDECSSVQQTDDGGYIVVGITTSFGSGPNDVYLIKLDFGGNTLWTKTFGGTSSDYGSSVQQTADGGYIIAGSTNSFGAGDDDLYLIKTDAAGDTLWSKTFGGTNEDRGYSVQQTADGGYVIAGATLSFGAGNTDVYLIKTDTGGNAMWTKTFGGTSYDYCYSVPTGDGGYVIEGYTNSFGAGDDDVYLIKTDSNGNSGCYEGNAATIVTSPSTIVGNPNLQVSSGSSEGNPATQTRSGGVVTTLCTSAGINELNSETSITVYPNPTAGRLTLTLSQGEGIVEIYNVLGETIYKSLILNPNSQIDLSSRSKGIYFLKVWVSTPSGQTADSVYTEKVVVQ